MEQIIHILSTAIEALEEANVSVPTEVEMFQGIYPSEWWIHTNVGYYVNVYRLHGLSGLYSSVYEYTM